jgi:hypothetical protein
MVATTANETEPLTDATTANETEPTMVATTADQMEQTTQTTDTTTANETGQTPVFDFQTPETVIPTGATVTGSTSGRLYPTNQQMASGPGAQRELDYEGRRQKRQRTDGPETDHGDEEADDDEDGEGRKRAAV